MVQEIQHFRKCNSSGSAVVQEVQYYWKCNSELACRYKLKLKIAQKSLIQLIHVCQVYIMQNWPVSGAAV